LADAEFLHERFLLAKRIPPPLTAGEAQTVYLRFAAKKMWAAGLLLQAALLQAFGGLFDDAEIGMLAEIDGA
jgi:hypothetical protein